MAPAVDKTSYELHVLRAAADGVEPALLLKAPGRKAEYLFNVPDGFSRLALEHKMSPSARLSCVLFTSLLPKSTGGLGGLILRLKQDGHGQFQIIGPRGSSSVAHSLRHICRWKHPKVFVSECCDNGPLPVFEDEHIVIVPLLAGDQSTGCPWCLYASPEVPSVDSTTSEQDDESTSSSSDSSSSDDSTSSYDTATSSGRNAREMFDERLIMLNTWSQMDEDVQSKELDADGRLNPHFSNGASACSMPHVGDQSGKEGCDLKGCQRTLPQQGKRDDAARNQFPLDLDESFFGHVRSELDKVKKTQPVRHSTKVSGGSNSASHAPRNKQLNSSNSLAIEGDFQSTLLGLTPNLRLQDDIEGRDALPNIAGGGDSPSLTCDANTGGLGCEGYSEKQRSPIASLKVDSCNSQKFTVRNCDGLSGLGASEDNDLNPAARGNWISDTAEVLPGSACGAKLLKNSLVHSMKPYDWHISNLQQDVLPQPADDSNPVYGRTPGHVGVIGITASEKDLELKNAGGSDSYVLGYVCFLRKLNAAVLVVDCRGVECVESLRRHRALNCIYHTSGGSKDDEIHRTGKMKRHAVFAVIHLTPHSLVQSSDYQTWMRSFTSPAHVVMNENSPEFGFQSSLATLKTLNNIHQDIFPLPPNITSSQRTRRPSQELNMNNMRIVDAELSMGLKFCKEGIPLSYISVDDSEPPLCSQQRSSLAETFEQIPELLLAEAGVQRFDARSCAGLTPNALVAAGIKRRLLEQKQELLSIGTAMKSRKIKSIDTIVGMKDCTREGDAFKSSSLSAISNGNQDSSELCRSEEKVDEDVDRAVSVQTQSGIQRVLTDEQQRIGQIKMTRNCGLLSQPRVLAPVLEFCDPASDFQLIFLGTGCAEPSKKRGSSGILLQVRGAQGAMLLDAGEGVTGQLYRRFGERGARTMISSLQCLWLSHKHGDHALGVLSILQTRSTQAMPLLIIGPHKVGQWLSEIRDIRAATGCPIPQFTFIHCDALNQSERDRNNQQHAKQLLDVLNAMQLQSMSFVKVFHCYDAYGIILNGRRGWRVVYSGDTRPCRQLIEAGRGCTLLIHEATFEDSLVEQAKQRRHSTVSEAVEVGWYMNARHIILTHFSQRCPEMVAINGDHNENISLAFDGMVVSSRLLDSLGTLLPLIRTAFQKTVNVLPITSTGQQRIDGPVMPIWQSEPLPSSQRMALSCENTCDAESLANKHWRWLSDSDDEAEAQRSEGDAVAISIRWSSDSDEEALFFQQQGVPMRGSPRDRQDTGEVEPFCSSEEIGGDDTNERVSSEDYHTVERASVEILETSGPFGGKHLRWIDSDSEDG